MSEKENRPSADTLEREAVGTTACKASLPTCNCTPNVAPGQPAIADYLGHGQGAAITRRDLENMTGLDGRKVREVIQQERLNGIPILSDNQSGYFLPVDEAEAERFVKSMRGRAREILKVARAVEKSMGLD